MRRLGMRALQLAALWAVAGCRLSQRATDRALERMSEQPRYDVYEASGFFRNGMVMQLPPAGTVARDADLDPVRSTGRSISGGYVKAVPLSVTPGLLELGRSRFGIYCAACHGRGGYAGSVVASNMTERRPPSLRSPTSSSLPAGFLFEVISRGLGRMPSYAAELPVDQRWAVVAYLHELQRTPNAMTDEQRADSTRGAKLRAQDSVRAAGGDSLP